MIICSKIKQLRKELCLRIKARASADYVAGVGLLPYHVAGGGAAEERGVAVAVLIDEIQYFNQKELGALIILCFKVHGESVVRHRMSAACGRSGMGEITAAIIVGTPDDFQKDRGMLKNAEEKGA
jgi:hypothetical protein